MIAGNTVKTDSTAGVAGILTVRSLTVDGTRMPAGTYTSANARWLEGKGKLIVQP
jgi:proline racemase